MSIDAQEATGMTADRKSENLREIQILEGKLGEIRSAMNACTQGDDAVVNDLEAQADRIEYRLGELQSSLS